MISDLSGEQDIEDELNVAGKTSWHADSRHQEQIARKISRKSIVHPEQHRPVRDICLVRRVIHELRDRTLTE